MPDTYAAYPGYQNTGHRWLGDVPASWEILAGKRVFANRREASRENDEQLAASQKFGVIPQSLMMQINDAKVMLALKGTASFRHVEKDDFVISLRSFEGGIEHSEYIGCVSPAYTVLSAKTAIDPRFYRYFFKSRPFITALQSTTDSLRDGKSITYEQFGSIPLILPKESEQQVIADFLDHETAKIDNLIEKQRRLIELLKEKRQAVISHAVTKGLNPDAPMHDSCVQWLGEVPTHWTTMQIRHVLPHMEQGKSPECENRPAERDEWGVLKTSCVNRALYNSQENKALPGHIEPFSQYEVKTGDVLMSRASGSVDLIGSVAYVHTTRPMILLSDKIFRLHLNSRVSREYFVYLMQSTFMRASIERAISGAEGMANNITKTAVRGFKFALPPDAEQEEIVTLLGEKVSLIDRMLGQAESLASILQERRSALISAAVTGKIDIREWHPPESSKKEAT